MTHNTQNPCKEVHKGDPTPQKPTIQEMLKLYPDTPAIDEMAYALTAIYTRIKVIGYKVMQRTNAVSDGWHYDLALIVEYVDEYVDEYKNYKSRYAFWHDHIRKITPEEIQKEQYMRITLPDFKLKPPK